MLARVSDLATALAAQQPGDDRIVVLMTLESGSRYGLTLVGDHPTWARDDGSAVTIFGEGTERAFVEVFEQSRSEFDTLVDSGAAQAGLPVEAALFSFPVEALVRAMLATRSAHYCRLALAWLLPSELRPLRADIAPVASDTSMPHDIRDLAERLVVPE